MAIDTGGKKPDAPEDDVLVMLQDWLDNYAGVQNRDRMFFTEQLILLLETGASLHEALQTLQNQAINKPMARMLDSLMTEISEGRSFSYALAQHPTVFSDTYVKLISASEAGGFMPQVLAELLDMEEKRDELKNTMSSAFSYPIFLLVFSGAVVIFVLTQVFPKFADMFSGIADELPGSTLFFMAASEVLIAHWPWITGGIVLLLLGIRQWVLSTSGKLWADRMKLRIPGLRSIFIQLYLVQSLRVMSLSLGNGVSVPDTLQSCRGVVDNAEYLRFVDSIEEQVLGGGGISIAFQNSDMMPDLVKHMIHTGEQSGNLAKVMARIADYYERELNRQLHSLSKMAEPFMLVVMGVVVGMLVSSLILPIFQLSSGSR